MTEKREPQDPHSTEFHPSPVAIVAAVLLHSWGSKGLTTGHVDDAYKMAEYLLKKDAKEQAR